MYFMRQQQQQPVLPIAPAVQLPPPPQSTPSAAVTFRNLKIGGLPPEITDDDLYEIFSKYGKIESAKVMLNIQTCESRGYGFVLFDTQEAGCRAFGELNGKTIEVKSTVSGEVISLTLDVKSSDWDGKNAAVESTAIYVRNIPASVTDDDIRSIFSQFGVILAVTTRFQRDGGKSERKAKQGQSAPRETSGSIGSRLATTPEALSSAMAFSPHQGDTSFELNPEEAGAAPTHPPTEALNKLAMIEFHTVEAAKSAIQHTHRHFLFPAAGNIPVLSKFADLPQVKENKRMQKKQQQQTVLSALSTPMTSISVGNRMLSLGAPPPPPSHLQSSSLMMNTPLVESLPSTITSFATSSNPSSIPLGHSLGSRYPMDASPLPLPARQGPQKIYYQGVLGITSEGALYPVRPEVCRYLDTGHTEVCNSYGHVGSSVGVTDVVGSLASLLRDDEDEGHFKGNSSHHHSASALPQHTPASGHQGLLQVVFADGLPTFFVLPNNGNNVHPHATSHPQGHAHHHTEGSNSPLET